MMTKSDNKLSYQHSEYSGIESVGYIPKHWSVLRCRDTFSFRKGLTITKENLMDEGIPCINYGEIHSKYAFEVNPDRHALKCVNEAYIKSSPGALLNKGDLIFADTSEDIQGSGNFAQFNSDVTAFAGYHTVIAQPIKQFNHRFLAYVCESKSFRDQIRKNVKGVKVYSITQSIIKSAYVWQPPKSEQDAIASFLDRKTSKLNNAILTKQKQIALLKERKHILIQQAVTYGINSDVQMKDSGVDWIGEIPAHWDVRKVKHIFNLVAEPAEKNNNHELLSVYTDIGVKPRRELEDRGNKASTTDGYWLVQEGDIIVNKLLAWMGAIGISEFNGVTSPAYDILRPKLDINGYFYHYLFRAGFCSSELKRHSRGIMDMRLRLYFDKFGVLLVPFPPVEEQNLIVRWIQKELAKIDGVIEHFLLQISRLEEYKTTLINSAVTGKIKVPEVEEPAEA